MNKAEKIEKLIEVEHPFEQAVQEVIGGIRHDFFQLEEGAIAKPDQEKAISEMRDSLRSLKDDRHTKLLAVYETLDENELDALLLLHESNKLKPVMLAAHDLKWEWVNQAKEMSPTMNNIIVEAGVNWMVNNTEGAVAESIAAQPLEDLKGGSADETSSDPPNAA